MVMLCVGYVYVVEYLSWLYNYGFVWSYDGYLCWIKMIFYDVYLYNRYITGSDEIFFY